MYTNRKSRDLAHLCPSLLLITLLEERSVCDRKQTSLSNWWEHCKDSCLHPHNTMHILHAVLYTFKGDWEENLFDNQKFL